MKRIVVVGLLMFVAACTAVPDFTPPPDKTKEDMTRDLAKCRNGAIMIPESDMKGTLMGAYIRNCMRADGYIAK